MLLHFLFTFMFLFHIIIILHFAVPAPQNSRRLTGNWREVAIYIHLLKRADGFDATSSYICLLLISIMTKYFGICLFFCFSNDIWLGVLGHVYNAALQQFPSLLKAETNFMCNAGLGKCYLTACQYDWCCHDCAMTYVYLMVQLRSFFVGSGHGNPSDRLCASNIRRILWIFLGLWLLWAKVFMKRQRKFYYGHLIRILFVLWVLSYYGNTEPANISKSVRLLIM